MTSAATAVPCWRLRKRASAEEIAEAEIDAAIAEDKAWKAAGRHHPT